VISELKTAFEIGFRALHPVHRDRHGDGEHPALDGHDDDPADHHLAAV
jgi:hypothetical protein